MQNNQPYIDILSRIFYGCCLIIIINRYFNCSLLSQLENPVLINPQANNTYWALLMLNIPQWCIKQGRFIETILVFSVFGALFKPQIKFFSFSFFISYSLYFITYNIYNIHHNHSFIGVWVMSFVFCFKSYFTTTLDLARYYTLFIFVSAGLWKTLRGSIFDPGHLATILSNQFSESYTNNNWLVSTLIDKTTVSHFLFLAAVVFQLFFVVGFFTKKYDKWLVFTFILFLLNDLIIMKLPFIEIYPLLLSFIQKDHLNYFLNNLTKVKSKIKINVS